MGKILKLLACVAVLAVFVAGGAVALTPAVSRITGGGHAEEEALLLSALNQRSLVYDRNGALQATLYGEQNRAPVLLAQIPQQVRDAIIVVEDENFYSHEGVNLRATLRALFENVSAGGVEQGGSTITMQVVKNAVLGSRRTLARKTEEAILAMRLEEVLTKDQILERYLNTAYFGNGAYGVQAAAETYWGVGVEQLDWGQAALLAALIRNPNGYNPIRFPDRAAERRALALDRLVETGRLTREEADAYSFQPLPSTVQRIAPLPDDYFLEVVKQQLLDDSRFNIGATPEERYNAVFSGGLRVFTTWDPGMQDAAERARDDILPGDQPGIFTWRYGGADQTGSAVVVTTDVRTGAVRALVGGPGFSAWQYDIATTGIGRQPGSSFKTFVLAAAFESGLVPDDTISGSAPCRIPNPGGDPDPAEIDNFGESRGGGGNITAQTQRSSNCAFARLGQIVGMRRVVDVAHRLGITTPLDAYPAAAIGTEEVLPLEMAAAYATFANDGIYNEPYYIDRIEDAAGNVLYQHAPDGRRAVTRQTARLVAEVLEANVRGGTGTRARVTTQDTAGKTGTAQRSHDAWFIGFTPQYATAVWMGALGSQVPMYGVGGISVTGGSYPARIFGQYMNEVLAGTEHEDFREPESTRRGRGLRLEGETGPGAEPPRTGGTRTATPTTAAPSQPVPETPTTVAVPPVDPVPPTTIAVVPAAPPP